MPSTKRGVEKIAKITPSQEAEIPRFLDKWNRIAVSTEPFDVDNTIEGIERFAEAWGAKPVADEFYETDSPATGWQYGGFDYDKDLPGEDYRVFYAMDRSGWATRCWLTKVFSPSVVQMVEAALERNVVTPLSLTHLAPRSIGAARRYLHYGQCDAPWLAVADFFATVFENEHCKKLSGLIQAVSSAGFIWLHPRKVVFCDRPEIAKYDERRRPGLRRRPRSPVP
jgi:hypothetical protein